MILSFYKRADGLLEAGDDETLKFLSSINPAVNVVLISEQDKDKQRTNKQNAALHKYFELLGKALNDAGWDMKSLLKEDKYKADVPWTKTSVKEYLWRPIQIAMQSNNSTAEASTSDYSEVYRALDRWSSQNLGVHVEWPSTR